MATNQIETPPAAVRLNEVQGPPPRDLATPAAVPAESAERSQGSFEDEPDNPLARLTPEQIEQLGREFDAIHDEVYAELGDRDARYIRSTIKLHRQLVLAARAMLLGSRYKPLWLGGTAALSVAKILENMEIGHNVMHGQWDWMNDPDINSQNWDWDTASPADAWRHSHNYEHHTFTNIRGKDRDLGYEIMRIDPHQKWHPVYLLQPFYNLILMGFFEWGVALHDLNFDAIRAGEKSKGMLNRELKAIGVKARKQVVKDYIAFPLLSGDCRRRSPPGATESLAERKPPRRALQVDARGELHGEHRAQRVGLLDHLLRAFPRSDLYVQPGGGRERDPRRLVRQAVARVGEHRRQPALSPARGQPQLPGRAPPLPGHALQPLRRDRAPRARDLPPLRAALQHRPAAASSSAPSTARSCGSPSRVGRSARSRGPTGPSRPRTSGYRSVLFARSGDRAQANSPVPQGIQALPGAIPTPYSGVRPVGIWVVGHSDNDLSLRQDLHMSATAGPVEAPPGPLEPTPSTEEHVPAPGGQGPTPEEIQEPVLENLDRFVTGLITVVPPALVVLAGWQLWNKELHLRDLVLLVILYIPIGLGVTVGFHRLLTHRSFKTSPGAARAVRGARHDVDRGPRDLVGRRSSQAPRLLRPPRRSRTAPTSTTAAAGRARCAASATRTSAGCSTTSSAERASASPRT